MTKKYLLALAMTVGVSFPAASLPTQAWRVDRNQAVSVDVSAVLNRLGLDLNQVTLPGNVVKVAPPIAAGACNNTTSELAAQYREQGNMRCRAVLASTKLKKAAKEQAVPKATAQ